jgi:hypothetical protein
MSIIRIREKICKTAHSTTRNASKEFAGCSLFRTRFQLHLRNKIYIFKILNFAVIIKTKLYLLCDGLHCRNKDLCKYTQYTLSRDRHLNLMFRIFFTPTVLLLIEVKFCFYFIKVKQTRCH